MLFEKLSKCHCFKCGQETLDIITRDGVAYRFSKFIKDEDMEKIKKLVNYVELDKMFCPECGAVYHIDWSCGIPQPIYDETMTYKFFLL